jgi:hypothetical protein
MRSKTDLDFVPLGLEATGSVLCASRRGSFIAQLTKAMKLGIDAYNHLEFYISLASHRRNQLRRRLRCWRQLERAKN